MFYKATILRNSVRTIAASLVFALSACAQPDTAGKDQDAAVDAAAEASLETDSAKASYTVGYGMSDDLRTRMSDDFEQEAFLAGVQDALNKELPQVGQEEGQKAMQAMSERAQAAAQQKAESTMAEGQTFLAENSKKDGVIALPSGLQYEVISEGAGDNPGATATVTTHYEGRLLDGTVFDSSVARGEPASFPLNRVIAGWTEALQLMQPGAKWRLFIPPNLAYGDRGAGSIPPNSTLIFEVELLSIDG